MNELLALLLANNTISFDKEELSFQIQSHPSYPSLHTITGVLHHFNIENIAVEVPIDSKTLRQLPNCFIAQIKTNHQKELVFVKRHRLEYIIMDGSKSKKRVSEKIFLEQFTGIVIAVEKSENEIIETNNNAIVENIVLGTVGVLIVALLILNGISMITFGYLILSIFGVLLSTAIVKQEQGIQTAIGSVFCSNVDEKKDCDAVLTSKGAKISGNYKLSDLSLLYFSGHTIALLFSSVSQQASFSILYLISLIALPITLYAIYYQYVIVKKWCFLCLSITGILWLQGGIVLFESSYITLITPKIGITTVLSFMICFALWNYLKPMLLSLKKLKNEKIAFVKFKRNFTLFENLLNKSDTIHTTIPNTDEIIFGNPNSPLEIIIVTNPFCGHCKPVHQLVDEILRKYKSKVKIIIRFNISTQNTGSNGVKVTSRILEIYHTKGKEHCLKAMDDIYSGMPTANWIQKWESCDETELYTAILENQKNWCSEQKINFTPEILIGGKSFPKAYTKEDLLFFIEDLEENYIMNNIELAI